jgi:hypothetical protein
VYRYQIDTETEMRIPRSTTHNYDPGVAPDGTVYHMRSGNDCGLNVQVVRYPEGGPVEVLASLAPNRDIGDSQLYRDVAMGEDHFYYSRVVCSSNGNLDIYQVVVDVPDGPPAPRRSQGDTATGGGSGPPGFRSPAAG